MGTNRRSGTYAPWCRALGLRALAPRPFAQTPFRNAGSAEGHALPPRLPPLPPEEGGETEKHEGDRAERLTDASCHIGDDPENQKG